MLDNDYDFVIARLKEQVRALEDTIAMLEALRPQPEVCIVDISRASILSELLNQN